MLERLLARGSDVKVTIETTCEMQNNVESANVVADLPGREKQDEIVLLSGHLDSWDLASGAIDDGAGCVISWEAARLMHELKLRPRRTIRVVLWMSEENGSAGAKAYAIQHEAEAGRHVVAFEADSGAGRPHGFGLTCADADLPRVQALAPLLRGLGCGVVTKGGGGADVSQLRRLAIPTMGLSQDDHWYFDYHHTPADTPDKVDPHELALNVAALSVMSYALAEMEPRLAPFPAPADEKAH
jgi:carboxypeptidase Q